MNPGFADSWTPLLLALLAAASLVTTVTLAEAVGRETRERRIADGDQVIAREMQAADLRRLAERLAELEKRGEAR